MSKSPIIRRCPIKNNKHNGKIYVHKGVEKDTFKAVLNSSTQTSNENPQIVADLVAELAVALHDKAKFETDNALLKVEFKEFEKKLYDLAEEKEHMTETIKKLQDDIKLKEISLTEKDVQFLEQQTKYLQELSDVTRAYYQQKEITDQTKTKLSDTINSLESKLNTTHLNFSRTANKVITFQTKSNTYKARLKYAINVIKNLSAILTKHCHKPSMVDEESQTTNSIKSRIDVRTSCCSVYTQSGLERENMMLSELFFKNKLQDSMGSLFFTNSSLDDEYT